MERDMDGSNGSFLVNGDAPTTNERLLIVDDEDVVRRVVARHLRRAGYEVDEAARAEAALEQVERSDYALAIIDIQMPGHDGLWLLRQLRARFPDLATMLLTAVVDVETSVHAMREGAYDYLTKPVARAELVFAVKRAIERRNLEIENRHYRDHLEDLVAQRTKQLHVALAGVREAQEETLQRLALAAEYRDDDTAAHCRRIGLLSGLIADMLRPQSEFAEMLRLAAPLHDIGKIGIPDSILHKPGPLTPEERRIMERHCEIGERILAGARSKVLALACSVAGTHHEKWNGSGYPRGLTGRDIALEGRIVALVDVFDALVSERCYKPAFPYEKAVDIITSESGRHFDPDVVDVFLSLGDTVRQIITYVPPVRLTPATEELETPELSLGLPALMNLRPGQ
jgi:putative two-component system response regulator